MEHCQGFITSDVHWIFPSWDANCRRYSSLNWSVVGGPWWWQPTTKMILIFFEYLAYLGYTREMIQQPCISNCRPNASAIVGPTFFESLWRIWLDLLVEDKHEVVPSLDTDHVVVGHYGDIVTIVIAPDQHGRRCGMTVVACRHYSLPLLSHAPSEKRRVHIRTYHMGVLLAPQAGQAPRGVFVCKPTPA